jgi:hypothetical protein
MLSEFADLVAETGANRSICAEIFSIFAEPTAVIDERFSKFAAILSKFAAIDAVIGEVVLQVCWDCQQNC